jgi:glycosyltransferase involved in cell wall biosynthesis
MIRSLVVGNSYRDIFAGLSTTFAGRQLPLEVRSVENEVFLQRAIADFRPHVILSFLPEGERSALQDFPWSIRRRWVNYPFGFTTKEHAIGSILSMYSSVIAGNKTRPQKLVSVITPVYNTGSILLRTYDSIRGQTYREWEWVIYDDPTDEETTQIVRMLAKDDSRISVMRGGAHSGFIGEVKRRAFRAAEGDVLVELDHDDELTEDCLQLIVDGFNEYPECGFAYTECAEVNADGSPVKYGDTFAFGYGSYRPFPYMYRGKPYLVTNYPQINQKTMRHIVGVPNHARAWTKHAYEMSGGHNPDLYVCDDYELILRTFLITRMLHIRHLGYIQNRVEGNSNTHITRNAEIQRQVALFSENYSSKIDLRAKEILGDLYVDEANQQLNLEYSVKETQPRKTGTNG